MDKSTIAAWIFLVLGFLAYSLSLWGVGSNQPRELTEDEKLTGMAGNDKLYKTSIAFIFIGLVTYVASSFFLGYKGQKAIGIRPTLTTSKFTPPPPRPSLVRPPSVTTS